jgi:hypothetical protein
MVVRQHQTQTSEAKWPSPLNGSMSSQCARQSLVAVAKPLSSNARPPHQSSAHSPFNATNPGRIALHKNPYCVYCRKISNTCAIGNATSIILIHIATASVLSLACPCHSAALEVKWGYAYRREVDARLAFHLEYTAMNNDSVATPSHEPPGNLTDITTTVQHLLRFMQPTYCIHPRGIVTAARSRGHLIALRIGFRKRGKRLVFPEAQTDFSHGKNVQADFERRSCEKVSQGLTPDRLADVE